jgi:hypothetical protein
MRRWFKRAGLGESAEPDIAEVRKSPRILLPPVWSQTGLTCSALAIAGINDLCGKRSPDIQPIMVSGDMTIFSASKLMASCWGPPCSQIAWLRRFARASLADLITNISYASCKPPQFSDHAQNTLSIAPLNFSY